MKNQYHHVKMRFSMTAKKLSKFHSLLLKNIENGSFSQLSRAEQHKRVDKLKERYNSYLHILQKGVAAGAITAAFLITLPSYAQIDVVQQFNGDNPLDSANILDGLNPVLVDIDGDNDLDLVVGTYESGIKYLENIGTISDPIFQERTGNDNPFSGLDTLYNLDLTFADIDNDGDFDAILSSTYYDDDEYNSLLITYRNNGDANTPIMVAIEGDSALFANQYIQPYTQAIFADVDIDGDIDVVLVDGYDGISYYENTGSKDSISLTERTGMDNPFDMNFVNYSAMSLVDIDGDNDLDFFSTEVDDTTQLWENTSNVPFLPLYVENSIDNSLSSTILNNPNGITFGDLNNDGSMDLIVGSWGNGFLYYESQPVTTGLATIETFEMTSFPNPVANSATITSEKVIESLRIHSTTGALMLSISPNTNAVELDLSDFNQGSYILSLTATDGSTSSQLITKD